MNRGLLKMSLVLIIGVAMLVGGAVTINGSIDAEGDEAYSFTRVDLPGDPYGMNDAGEIVGKCGFECSGSGFLFSDGSFTTIDFPGADSTVASGINDAGEIVGYYSVFEGGQGGFLLSDGSYTTIDVPWANSTYPQDINNAGEIVGLSSTHHAFLFSDGTFTKVDFSTYLYGINDAGESAGYRYIDGVYYGCLFSDGSFTTFRIRGADTYPAGISNAGEIAGEYLDNDTLRNFVFADGSFTEVDFPGAEWTKVYDINNAGQLVGEADSIGFVATPILGQVVEYSGDVSVSGHPAEVGDPVHGGDLMVVGEGGLARFEMRLREAVHDLDVGSNSEVEIADESTRSEMTLELFKGKIRGKVRDLPEGIKFDLLTPVSVIGVRGTEWIVEVDEASTLVSVLEGSVEVSTRDATDSVIVEEYYQLQATPEGIGEPYPIDPDDVDSWWSRRFVFLPLVLK